MKRKIHACNARITTAGSMTTCPPGNDIRIVMLATFHPSLARPVIRCGRLPDFDDSDLSAVRAAFVAAAPCAMGQEWRAEPEPGFTPGQVRVAWRPGNLVVFAELTDRDIFSHATGDNQRTWELGDIFELFLRPSGQTEYLELHVTPNNHRLQLRFPDAAAFDRLCATGRVDEFLLAAGTFHSRTWVQPENRKWFVLAEIPARTVCGQAQLIPGSRWHFSFSRYDYTRGNPEPVISSTSPHPVASFHRQADWGMLTLVNSNF